MPAYKYETSLGKTLWYCSFHYVDWTGKNIRKKKKGFATKKAALEWERKFLDRLAKDSSITYEALVEEYLKDQSIRLKPTTMSIKENILRTKTVPYFGKMKLREITPLTIRKWQSELKEKEEFTDTYLRQINSQLIAIMNYAVKYYKLQSNPCNIAGAMGKHKAGKMSFWTKDEFENFYKYLKSDRYRCFFNTLYYTGMREGELLAITPADIPKDEAVIHISKNFAVVNGQQLIITPKTKESIRSVTIHERLHKQLLAYVDGLCLGKHDRIFDIGKSSVYREFKVRTKESGNKEIRVHDLRHSHAALLIEMGFPIELISERLGHESYEITLRTYAHLYPGKHDDVPKKITEMLEKGTVEQSEKVPD